ncbi:MAG TPA: HAMP domain-containing sensor histidine kinase [Thermotogota bacterium]|nr:HAMP domain-containing sensor histidine kinase [Thermotogota bacterium]HPJ90105.1 HAMP domain-containing sensor histidine kinase [Thermotogota bacterium]HPR95700.1 HAMP domain-containing sensor histidine kinase [Thermotogota bacterium]
MKISLKTGIINSAAFLLLSVLTVVFFQISARNIIINSHLTDLKNTAEHFLQHEEYSWESPGKGRNFSAENRYSLLSEGIYIAEINGEKNILQDPYGLGEEASEGIFASGEMVFIGVTTEIGSKTFLVAGDLTAEYESINLFRTISVLFIIITIIVSLVLGIITTRLSLNPWKKFLNIIKNINTSDLSKRFSVEGQEDEIREMEQSLNSMLERLETGFELQKRFSSDAAHELRTPVTSIKGYAQILQKWGLADKKIAEESVDSIVETVNEMEDMIEKLLTLSRLEAETIRMETFDTADWLIRLKKSLRRKYPDRNIVFENEGFTKTLTSSEKYLSILISIFVDNAVKYSDARQDVSIILKKKTIIVKDQGVGIPEGEIDKIFERFYQVDASRKKTENKGFGIGLSIARKIIRLLNIDLSVNSRINHGTEITLTMTEES